MSSTVQEFQCEGFCIERSLATSEECVRMASLARDALTPLVGPVEFEVDAGYPGAPNDRNDKGGETPRRLLNAYERGVEFRSWASDPRVSETLKCVMGRDDVLLSHCHHNCIMTKHPGYSSATMWHQDIRYWSFDRPELISVWLALSDETIENGALQVIPGSHRLEVDQGRLDRDLFLRPHMGVNMDLIETAVPIELSAGDVLFFHSRLFHAAGRNNTRNLKLSLVFTYHDSDNHPVPGTRSGEYPSYAL